MGGEVGADGGLQVAALEHEGRGAAQVGCGGGRAGAAGAAGLPKGRRASSKHIVARQLDWPPGRAGAQTRPGSAAGGSRANSRCTTLDSASVPDRIMFRKVRLAPWASTSAGHSQLASSTGGRVPAGRAQGRRRQRWGSHRWIRGAGLRQGLSGIVQGPPHYPHAA